MRVLSSPSRRAFTLVELMVVLAIIAILIGLTIPAIMKIRSSAQMGKCKNNLRQIALAVHAYHDAEGKLPVNSLNPTDPLDGTSSNYGPQSKAWSWLARLLPYIEEDAVFRQANIPTNTLWQSQEAAAAKIKVFLCPSDSSFTEDPRADAADLGEVLDGPSFPPYMAAGQTNYKGVSGANWMYGDPQWHNPGTNGQWDGLTHGDGLFYRSDFKRTKRLTNIQDGASQTFMIGEDIPQKNHWCSWPYANNAVGTCAIAPNAKRADGSEYDPRDWPNTYGFRSRHSGGLHFAYADASVHFITQSIDLKTYRAMATIRGQEAVTPP